MVARRGRYAAGRTHGRIIGRRCVAGSVSVAHPDVALICSFCSCRRLRYSAVGVSRRSVAASHPRASGPRLPRCYDCFRSRLVVQAEESGVAAAGSSQLAFAVTFPVERGQRRAERPGWVHVADAGAAQPDAAHTRRSGGRATPRGHRTGRSMLRSICNPCDQQTWNEAHLSRGRPRLNTRLFSAIANVITSRNTVCSFISYSRLIMISNLCSCAHDRHVHVFAIRACTAYACLR